MVLFHGPDSPCQVSFPVCSYPLLSPAHNFEQKTISQSVKFSAEQKPKTLEQRYAGCPPPVRSRQGLGIFNSWKKQKKKNPFAAFCVKFVQMYYKCIINVMSICALLTAPSMYHWCITDLLTLIFIKRTHRDNSVDPWCVYGTLAILLKPCNMTKSSLRSFNKI